MDRHLLPDEIDSLLDGEVGFGIAPLKAHVRRCAQCAAELEGARTLVRALEHLPHFSPSPLFSARVMERVQVFVPWHAALLDTARRWLPRSRPVRALAGAGVGAMAVMLTLVSLWLVSRLDTVIFAVDLLLDRTRAVLAAAVSGGVADAFGEPALRALQGGSTLILTAALLLLVLAAAVAVRMLRALVGARPRR